MERYDANTVRWTLTPSQWTTLTAQPAAALSVAVTAALRASSWSSGLPLLPAPDWIKATKPVFSSPSYPVEVRESLSSLASFVNATTTENTTKLYEEIDNLALAVSGAGTETVFEDMLAARMHAHPFTEPVTGLDYVRARWYQPLSGTWLTPDPLGYRDSSNLYVFAGGDPVNGRDPDGMCDRKKNEGFLAWGARCTQEGLASGYEVTKRELAHTAGGALAVVATGTKVVVGLALIVQDPPGDPAHMNARDREFHQQHYAALKQSLLHPFDTIKQEWRESSDVTLQAEQSGKHLQAGYAAGGVWRKHRTEDSYRSGRRCRARPPGD